ncbi:hypothetical protein ACTXT7_010971 [Hymenolepis weldensis]
MDDEGPGDTLQELFVPKQNNNYAESNPVLFASVNACTLQLASNRDWNSFDIHSSTTCYVLIKMLIAVI